MPLHIGGLSASGRSPFRSPGTNVVRLAVLLAAGAWLASCSSTPVGALPAIPALGHGGAAGAASAPAIAVPSPGTVQYVVEGTLPTLADHATVYRAGATASTAQVSRLATAFGLLGAVQSDASGWTVTDGDRQVRVDRVGGLPWSFSPPSGGTSSSGCAVAVPGGTGTDQSTSPTPPPTCPPTTTAPGLPDEHGAEQRASEVLGQAGVDVSGATVTATGGSDAWTVTFSPVLDGLAVLGGATSVTVGAHGGIVSANGHLASPSPAGSYPLVGVPAGVDRLRQGWDWIVYGGPVPLAALGGTAAQAAGGSGAGAGSSETAVPPVAPPASTPGPTVPQSTEPQSTAPVPSVAPTIVKITGMHLARAWAWPLTSPNEVAWLVPVYVFQLGPGNPYPFLSAGVPVLAVADRYVTEPTTTTAPTGSAVPGSPPSKP